jgi:RHS repeat-associated protein
MENNYRKHMKTFFITSRIPLIGVLFLTILVLPQYCLAQSQDKNYVHTYVPQLKIKDEVTFQSVETDVTKVQSTIVYYDGLGRPLQTVNYKASPSSLDVVVPVVYDNFGRETIKFLPYTSTEGNGNFKPNAIEQNGVYTGSAHHIFYHAENDKVENDAKPYAETKFEVSPLNRVFKQGMPGASWQPIGNSYSLDDNTVKYQYELNGIGEVLLWSYDVATHRVNARKPDNSLNYFPANKLTVVKTYNEDKKLVITYTDDQGKTLLKRVQATDATFPVNDQNFASSYYIYDDADKLCVVLPPEASKRLASEYHAAVITAQEDFLALWAYRYKYDARHRMIEKQVPGAAPVLMVYDKRDRLVLTQDGEQRKKNPKEWSFTKFDAYNNSILTGIYKDTENLGQAGMQQKVNTFYTSAPANKWYEDKLTSDQTSLHGYTDRSFPAGVSENDFLTVTYYDDYSFKVLININSMLLFDYVALLNNEAYNPSIRGMVTGVKTKVLNQNRWLWSTNYYDSRYRLIQSAVENIQGGVDRMTNEYDFNGKLLRSKTQHAGNNYAASYTDRNVYDHAGRIRSTHRAVEKVSTKSNAIQWKAYGGNGGTVDIDNTKNTVTKTSANGWNTDIVNDTQRVETGSAVQFTVTGSEMLLGLAYGAGYNVYVGWYVAGDHLEVYKSYEFGANLGSYQLGDVLGVQYDGYGVSFIKNGVPVHYIYFDGVSYDAMWPSAALYKQGATLSGASMTMQGQETTLPGYGTEVQIAAYEYNALGQLVTKKLHSTDGSTFKQNVDYRYNIRGWLKKINDPVTPDASDFFNMELQYNTPTASGGTAQFSGNISEIVWRNADNEKQSYGFYYDAMSRMKEAKYYNTSTPSRNGMFNEKIGTPTGIDSGYDLNGNIMKLTRYGKKDDTTDPYGLMDNLNYTYTGNQLTRVDDAIARNTAEEGFKEATQSTSGSDYGYDANGNLIKDLNKGILSIEYNHLNLPSKVKKSNTEYIVYTYDATGRKLRQQVFGTESKTTDYIGSVVYEDSKLQFINHSEGRVLVTDSGQEYQYHLKDHLGNVRLTFTTKESTENALATFEPLSAPTEQGKFLHYDEAVKVKSSLFDHTEGSSTGSTTIFNSDFSAFTGQGCTVTIYGEENGNYLDFACNANETGKVSIVVNTIPGKQYRLDFTYDYTGLEPLLVRAAGSEYSNFFTGSNSVTFIASGYSTSIEFIYTSQVQAVVSLFSVTVDRLYSSSTEVYATRLNGSANERIGLAKSLSVMPGDVINLEVYAKYVSADNADWTAAFRNFMTSIALGTAPAGTVVDGGAPGSIGGLPFPFGSLLNKTNESGNAPKSYLNWIIFDRNYKFINGGYQRLSTIARERGQDVAHERLASTISITQPGYVYVYLSNEEATAEVFFDDFTVQHVKSPVIATNDYYPFGLTFNSYQRENSVPNKYKFNGKEEQTELNLGWLDFGARMYDPAIGRWMVIDPLAEKARRWSPYVFGYDNPIRFIDPDGMEAIDPQQKDPKEKTPEDLKKAQEGKTVQNRVENVNKSMKEGDYIKSKTVTELAGIPAKETKGEPEGSKEKRDFISKIDKIVKTKDGYVVKLNEGVDKAKGSIIMVGKDGGKTTLDVSIKNGATVSLSQNKDGSTTVNFSGIKAGLSWTPNIGLPNIKLSGDTANILGIDISLAPKR